jgi:hypothetical protein
VFISCQKEKKHFEPENPFASTAKEWYYSSFKRSAEWKQSPLHGKKLPEWNHSIYKKIGNMEIVEFPLVSARKAILIPSSEALSSADKRRIAEASLNKISFVRKPDQSMKLREISYVPTLQYLKQNNYDISRRSVLNAINDFTGQIIIRNWKGKVLSIKQSVNGQITRKLKTGRKENKSQSSGQQQMKDGFCSGPNDLWECEFIMNCDVIAYGDGMQVWENCELEPTDNCTPVYCEDPGDDPCLEMTGEECACQFYGIGCGEGSEGDDPEEEACPDYVCPNDIGSESISEQISSTTGTQATGSNGLQVRTDQYKWYFARNQASTVSWKYWSLEETDAEQKYGNWRFTAVRHLNIGVEGSMPACIDSNPTITSATGSLGSKGSSAKMILAYEMHIKVTCCNLCPEVTRQGQSLAVWTCTQ